MTVTVLLCIRRGCKSSIRSVKVKSRNGLDLERATPSGIDEQSFSLSVQIPHGSGNKTLSHYDAVQFASEESRAAPMIAIFLQIIHHIQ
jgi:hypothetical protein